MYLAFALLDLRVVLQDEKSKIAYQKIIDGITCTCPTGNLLNNHIIQASSICDPPVDTEAKASDEVPLGLTGNVATKEVLLYVLAKELKRRKISQI